MRHLIACIWGQIFLYFRFATAKSDRLRKAKRYVHTRVDPVQYIKSLDLGYLSLSLLRRHAWDETRTHEAIRKYKNFLILNYLYPHQTLIPDVDLDEVWHEHILYSRRYEQDCHRIFGRHLHHELSPTIWPRSEMKEEDYVETGRLYAAVFHEPYMMLSLEDRALLAVSRYEQAAR
jgi:hypothetical protein